MLGRGEFEKRYLPRPAALGIGATLSATEYLVTVITEKL